MATYLKIIASVVYYISSGCWMLAQDLDRTSVSLHAHEISYGCKKVKLPSALKECFSTRHSSSTTYP